MQSVPVASYTVYRYGSYACIHSRVKMKFVLHLNAASDDLLAIVCRSSSAFSLIEMEFNGIRCSSFTEAFVADVEKCVDALHVALTHKC
jgi:hypothetical protein